MAYLLRFDGVDDRVACPATISFTDLKITWTGRFAALAGGDRGLFQSWAGAIGNDTQLVCWYDNPNGLQIVMQERGGAKSLVTSGILGLDTATIYRVEFSLVSASSLTLEVYNDESGALVATRNVGHSNTYEPITFLDIGDNPSGLARPFNGDFYGLTVEQLASATNNYDPSASNGTGQILPDTVGSNDGTLVNFPTDDSQWVFYDDGQGGIVTADAVYTIAAPVFTANASVTLPAPIADAAFSIGAPLFNASASATLPQPTADGAFSIASPLFSASATATLPQPIADAAFTINAPTFSASATATIPGFSASVSFAVPAPAFSADAAVTLPSPTSDVSYTIAAPTFSVNADATLPQPSSDVAFAINSPQFAVTATATEPGFNASVNFTVNAPIFSGNASATLPQPNADVNFTVSAPTFSVVAIVGGIAIIVDDETNITLKAQSNNIDLPALSNNLEI